MVWSPSFKQAADTDWKVRTLVSASATVRFTLGFPFSKSRGERFGGFSFRLFKFSEPAGKVGRGAFVNLDSLGELIGQHSVLFA